MKSSLVRARILLLPLLALVASCNQAQPTVNRVQPNAIQKSVFEGDWYFLQTVIDTPYSASYTFVGEQGDTEKIIWEIQENYLIARRSYQFISNSEIQGLAGSTETGAAIAAYKIESHFDIRRDYNPTTGEELNVVVENDSDRPWYEREYMRVDWSQNLITSNFLMFARLFDGIEAEPVAYYVQPGHGDPHEPKFLPGANDPDHIGYIDIVNKLFVRPTVAHIEGFGDVPTCLLTGSEFLDCAPGEITVRNSFMKVDATRDYEPFRYTGDRMDRFGYFVTERAGYDEQYGVVEPARFRFTNRHNLWVQSHKLDAAGAPLRCTEANAGMVCGGGGSSCDIAWARSRRERDDSGDWLGACTIPYRERDVRKVPYHVSENFPAELLPDMDHVIEQWNSSFVDTIASLRENECLADGGDAAGCASQRTRDDGQSVVVLCHNPVLADDDASCGGEGTIAEIGDLRYSLIGWVSDPHSSSPLGYGPSSADPETGEILMGNAFIYGAALDTLAAYARDLLALLNGDISSTQISDASVVNSWVERQRAPGSAITGLPRDDHAGNIDGFNVDRVNQAMDFSWATSLLGPHDSSRARPTPGQAVAAINASRDRLLHAGAFGTGDDRGQARLQNLVGTDIERMLTNDELRVAAGVDPNLPLDEAALNAASPLRGMSIDRRSAYQRAQAIMAAHGSCVLRADFADDGLLGLARAVKHAADAGDGTMEWYGRSYDVTNPAAVRDMLRHPIFEAVTAHEFGHTLGLRHNFSGSHDSLNYGAHYWQLRDDGHMEPRAWDPMTDAEIDGRIREDQYSTVMDYGNNFVVTDANGIGHYDRAAIKMGYGDMVEVFTNAPDVGEIAWISFIKSAGWPVMLKLEAFTGTGEVTAYPYTELPGVLGGIANIEQRADVPYTSLRSETFLASQGIDDPLVDASGRPTVPYEFCSDEQADLDPDCLRYDAGADPYETINSIADSYWDYYSFNAFRRGRLGYDTGPYADRILNRYMVKLQYANQIYSLYRPIFTDIFGTDPSFDAFWTREDGMGAYTAAVGTAFETFTRVITAPEPGSYTRHTRPDGTSGLTSADGGFGGGVNVNAFDGRYLDTTWNFNDGYFWFDQLERSGFYYDKVLALMVLTDPETHFIGRDTAADVRSYQINFYSSFAPSMTSFFRGLVGEDWQTVSPRVVSGQLRYPDALQLASSDMPGTPVDPNASFSIQLAAAVYGMALIPQTYDQTYMNKSRIWAVGGAEAVTLDPSIPTISFTDPASGLTYVAASYPDATTGAETAPGAQMLLHAQALLDQGSMGPLASYIDNVNIIRRLSWLIDFGG